MTDTAQASSADDSLEQIDACGERPTTAVDRSPADNPLLRELLRLEYIKPRLRTLGTSPASTSSMRTSTG
jgi:hypothetical protein